MCEYVTLEIDRLFCFFMILIVANPVLESVLACFSNTVCSFGENKVNKK